jgi:hypothetical protein
MAKAGSATQTRRGSTELVLPLPFPRPPLPPEKHLDDALLAAVRRRKVDRGVFPGVPFN